MRRQDEPLGRVPPDTLDADLVLGARFVEDENALPGPETKRAQVPELRPRDPHARSFDLRPRDEEAQHYGSRSSVSVRHSSSARVSVTCQPWYAAVTVPV